MPISVTCPECNSTYRVADEAAGKAIKCKKCGARVAVPAGDDDLTGIKAGAPRNGDEAGGDEGGEAKGKKKGGSGKIIAIVAGALVGACCICTGIGGGVGWWVYTKAKDTVNEVQAKIAKDMQKGPIGGGGGGGGGGGAVILDKKDTLTEKDPPKANGKPAKEYKVKLEQGKTYVIDMKAVKRLDLKKIDFKNPPHDPYLRLLDPQNRQIAVNDDFEPGVSLDSQIRYTPMQTGDYTIQATVLGIVPQGGMPFTLTVKQQ